MALKDVYRYYYDIQAQYLEMKADLADFEQALKDGHITEDQLEDIKNEVAKIECNYDRLTYIMYLLEIPKRKSKRPQYYKANAKLIEAFNDLGACQTKVEAENHGALYRIRQEIKKLK